MSSPIDALNLITNYLSTHRNPVISYSQLLAFSERYLQTNELDNPHMEDLRRDTHRVLSQHLRSLDNDNKIEIQRSDNQPLSIYYEAYFHKKIGSYYDKVFEDMTRPLATEENLSLELPEDRINSIDIKSDLVEWLNGDHKRTKIIRLLFPSGIKSLIATTDLLQKSLITASIQKIRQYLNKQRNHSYLSQKLIPIFKGRETAVRDLMRMITQSAESASHTIVESSDFSFQVWTQLSTFIIKEYESKTDKLEDEHNFCQAAYLIGYYCVFYKGKEQKKKDEASAIKMLVTAMKKPPYAFTISEIQRMKDDKGIPLLKKFSKETLHAFIESQTETPEKHALPPLLSLKLPDDSLVYIYASTVGKVLENQRVRAGKTFRDFYKNSWYSAMMENDTLNTMEDDEEFRRHITDRLRERFPLLFTLLRFELLYLMTQESDLPEIIRNQCRDYLDVPKQTIKDIDLILGLDRKRILSDARILLPFWMSIPILRGIILLFRRMFLGQDFVERYHSERFDHEEQTSTRKRKARRKEPTGVASKQFGSAKGSDNGGEMRAVSESSGGSSAATAKASKAEFKHQVQRLENDFLERGKSLEMTMRELIDKWNPILDKDKRKDLVEDVNAMCRDFVRGLKISYRSPPPKADAIREMAKRLAGNDTFERIRDRNYLEQYIQLYILKILGR